MDLSKIGVALERIRLADSMSRKYMDGQPLYVCVSGGKDSSVIQQLSIDAGIDVIFVHKITTVDAPETVHFIYKEFGRLRDMGYGTKILHPDMSMWRLIEHKRGFLPTRQIRYCCTYFKERRVTTESGMPAFIVTGVRWDESVKRKKRGEYEVLANKISDRIIIHNDNDPGRKLYEECKIRAERICNPIIDWSDADVWDYIHDKDIPYNPLYDEGFHRIGCIGCPLASKSERQRQFLRWPKYKKSYIDAIERGRLKAISEGRKFNFSCAVDAFDWWMEEKKDT